MHNKYIKRYECHDNALRMWKVVQLEKYFDFSLYSHHFSLFSLTSLLSAPEREVTSPSDFKVVGALDRGPYIYAFCQVWFHLAQLFQRRRLKCEKVNGQTTDAKWWQYLTWPFRPGELKINKLQKKIWIRKLKDSQYHVQRKTDEKTMFYHTPKRTSLKNRGWNQSLWKGK
jgi:hypothetical protein